MLALPYVAKDKCNSFLMAFASVSNSVRYEGYKFKSHVIYLTSISQIFSSALTPLDSKLQYKGNTLL